MYAIDRASALGGKTGKRSRQRWKLPWAGETQTRAIGPLESPLHRLRAVGAGCDWGRSGEDLTPPLRTRVVIVRRSCRNVAAIHGVHRVQSIAVTRVAGSRAPSLTVLLTHPPPLRRVCIDGICSDYGFDPLGLGKEPANLAR